MVGEISDAVRAQDFARAAALADAVLALGMQHPVVYNARALAFQRQGQFREALTEFNRARALTPDDANLHNAIGLCLASLNQPAEAIQAFDAAIAFDPRNAQAHYRKGWLLEMLGDAEAAGKLYEGAVSLDPSHADALGSLAALKATALRFDEAKTFAERALGLNPNQASAIVALGTVELHDKNYAAAERHFRSVIDEPHLTFRARAILHGLLADALDGQDRVNEAFAAYRFEKNEIRKLYAQNYANQPRPREAADLIAAFLASIQKDDFAAHVDAKDEGATNHVFVVGFEQSGVSELARLLSSHPDIDVIEGHDFLADMAQTYLTSDAGLRRLMRLAIGEGDTHRKTYWTRVRDRGLDPAGKTIVDALPLHAAKLPLIAELFPGAKVVIAARDPRDVLLSCYRGHFRINPITFEFLTLEDTVDLYASMTKLVDEARTKLAIAFYTQRYEDSVGEDRESLAALFAFIGLAPPDDVESPQVDKAGIGRWRAYRDHLRMVLPQLRPLAQSLGYGRD